MVRSARLTASSLEATLDAVPLFRSDRNRGAALGGFHAVHRFFTPLLASLAALLLVLPALAGPRKPRVSYEDFRRSRPSARYAQLDRRACEKELLARKIAFTLVTARGVQQPVRLRADISGVTFHTGEKAAARARSPAEVYDCRLVLALSDWSKILAAHGIDEVRTISAWRPSRSTHTEGKLAVRHSGGLAVDIKRLGKKAVRGTTERVWLDIAKDFHGRIGAPVCGAASQTARLPASAKELRAIVCEAKRLGIFTSILTPSYDRAHRNHLHVEIRPGVEWSLLL